jgi:hypothetical protein
MLTGYYDQAVRTIRSAGMHQDHVTVILPLFQRPIEEIVKAWGAVSSGRHGNVCFDVHLYHCFEHVWNGKTLAQQLRSVQENAEALRGLPAVVGEWSLALGAAAKLSGTPPREARALFGRAQLEAYESASHGWFFWNWSDAHGSEWDWQQSFHEGSFSGTPLRLPLWCGTGEDPLEELLDPPPPEPQVRVGDAVFLRAFHGRYLDLAAARAFTRWADRGEWQRFVVCLPEDGDGSEGSAVGPRSFGPALADGDVVRLRSHSGRFLVADPSSQTSSVVGCFPDHYLGAAADFVLHVRGGGPVRHRSTVSLESCASSCAVDVDEGKGECVRTRWKGFGGSSQSFVLELALAPPAPEEKPAASRKRPVAATEEVPALVKRFCRRRMRSASLCYLLHVPICVSAAVSHSYTVDSFKRARLPFL